VRKRTCASSSLEEEEERSKPGEDVRDVYRKDGGLTLTGRGKSRSVGERSEGNAHGEIGIRKRFAG